MKKIYYMMLLAWVSMTIVSCSDWDSPYHYDDYYDDIVGSWVSEYGGDYYGEYDLYGYDVVRYDFFSNHTGNYCFYDSYGMYRTIGFDWETRRGRLYINYYDGDYDYLYYGFDDYGYLILSTDSRFRNYTAYRPGGYYYEPAKTAEGDKDSKQEQVESTGRAKVKVKSVSKALKARDEESE